MVADVPGEMETAHQDFPDLQEATMYADSCEQVLQMEFLLGKIHERIKGSETFLHARQVNSF